MSRENIQRANNISLYARTIAQCSCIVTSFTGFFVDGSYPDSLNNLVVYPNRVEIWSLVSDEALAECEPLKENATEQGHTKQVMRNLKTFTSYKTIIGGVRVPGFNPQKDYVFILNDDMGFIVLEFSGSANSLCVTTKLEGTLLLDERDSIEGDGILTPGQCSAHQKGGKNFKVASSIIMASEVRPWDIDRRLLLISQQPFGVSLYGSDGTCSGGSSEDAGWEPLDAIVLTIYNTQKIKEGAPVLHMEITNVDISGAFLNLPLTAQRETVGFVGGSEAVDLSNAKIETYNSQTQEVKVTSALNHHMRIVNAAFLDPETNPMETSAGRLPLIALMIESGINPSYSTCLAVAAELEVPRPVSSVALSGMSKEQLESQGSLGIDSFAFNSADGCDTKSFNNSIAAFAQQSASFSSAVSSSIGSYHFFKSESRPVASLLRHKNKLGAFTSARLRQGPWQVRNVSANSILFPFISDGPIDRSTLCNEHLCCACYIATPTELMVVGASCHISTTDIPFRDKIYESGLRFDAFPLTGLEYNRYIVRHPTSNKTILGRPVPSASNMKRDLEVLLGTQIEDVAFISYDDGSILTALLVKKQLGSESPEFKYDLVVFPLQIPISTRLPLTYRLNIIPHKGHPLLVVSGETIASFKLLIDDGTRPELADKNLFPYNESYPLKLLPHLIASNIGPIADMQLIDPHHVGKDILLMCSGTGRDGKVVVGHPSFSFQKLGVATPTSNTNEETLSRWVNQPRVWMSWITGLLFLGEMGKIMQVRYGEDDVFSLLDKIPVINVSLFSNYTPKDLDLVDVTGAFEGFDTSSRTLFVRGFKLVQERVAESPDKSADTATVANKTAFLLQVTERKIVLIEYEKLGGANIRSRLVFECPHYQTCANGAVFAAAAFVIDSDPKRSYGMKIRVVSIMADNTLVESFICPRERRLEETAELSTCPEGVGAVFEVTKQYLFQLNYPVCALYVWNYLTVVGNWADRTVVVYEGPFGLNRIGDFEEECPSFLTGPGYSPRTCKPFDNSPTSSPGNHGVIIPVTDVPTALEVVKFGPDVEASLFIGCRNGELISCKIINSKAAVYPSVSGIKYSDCIYTGVSRSDLRLFRLRDPRTREARLLVASDTDAAVVYFDTSLHCVPVSLSEPEPIISCVSVFFPGSDEFDKEGKIPEPGLVDAPSLFAKFYNKSARLGYYDKAITAPEVSDINSLKFLPPILMATSSSSRCSLSLTLPVFSYSLTTRQRHIYHTPLAVRFVGKLNMIFVLCRASLGLFLIHAIDFKTLVIVGTHKVDGHVSAIQLFTDIVDSDIPGVTETISTPERAKNRLHIGTNGAKNQGLVRKDVVVIAAAISDVSVRSRSMWKGNATKHIRRSNPRLTFLQVITVTDEHHSRNRHRSEDSSERLVHFSPIGEVPLPSICSDITDLTSYRCQGQCSVGCNLNGLGIDGPLFDRTVGVNTSRLVVSCESAIISMRLRFARNVRGISALELVSPYAPRFATNQDDSPIDSPTPSKDEWCPDVSAFTREAWRSALGKGNKNLMRTISSSHHHESSLQVPIVPTLKVRLPKILQTERRLSVLRSGEPSPFGSEEEIDDATSSAGFDLEVAIESITELATFPISNISVETNLGVNAHNGMSLISHPLDAGQRRKDLKRVLCSSTYGPLYLLNSLNNESTKSGGQLKIAACDRLLVSPNNIYALILNKEFMVTLSATKVVRLLRVVKDGPNMVQRCCPEQLCVGNERERRKRQEALVKFYKHLIDDVISETNQIGEFDDVLHSDKRPRHGARGVEIGGKRGSVDEGRIPNNGNRRSGWSASDEDNIESCGDKANKNSSSEDEEEEEDVSSDEDGGNNHVVYGDEDGVYGDTTNTATQSISHRIDMNSGSNSVVELTEHNLPMNNANNTNKRVGRPRKCFENVVSCRTQCKLVKIIQGKIGYIPFRLQNNNIKEMTYDYPSSLSPSISPRPQEWDLNSDRALRGGTFINNAPTDICEDMKVPASFPVFSNEQREKHAYVSVNMIGFSRNGDVLVFSTISENDSKVLIMLQNAMDTYLHHHTYSHFMFGRWCHRHCWSETPPCRPVSRDCDCDEGTSSTKVDNCRESADGVCLDGLSAQSNIIIDGDFVSQFLTLPKRDQEGVCKLINISVDLAMGLLVKAEYSYM